MRAAVVNAGLEVIDLVIQNIAGANHPFHLHNSPMFVLSSGPGVISPESVSLFTILDLSVRADCLTPARREASRLQHNLTNPLRRDTITVAPGTWRVVRVITDIPGTLLFHCHIVWRKHTMWWRVQRNVSLTCSSCLVCRSSPRSSRHPSRSAGTRSTASDPARQRERRSETLSPVPRRPEAKLTLPFSSSAPAETCP